MRVVVLHRKPSLKFIGLDIRKIWRTMCVSINGPGDPHLWPFDLEIGRRVASKVGNFPFFLNFGTLRPLGSRIIRYVRDGRTNRQTDKRNAYCPFATGTAGHNNHDLSALPSYSESFVTIALNHHLTNKETEKYIRPKTIYHRNLRSGQNCLSYRGLKCRPKRLHLMGWTNRLVLAATDKHNFLHLQIKNKISK